MGTVFIFFVGRRHCVETEGLPGLHSFSSAEWRHSGPGGEGEDHPGRPSWVPRSEEHTSELQSATGHSARTRAAAWREPVVSHATVASQPSQDPFVMKVRSHTH